MNEYEAPLPVPLDINGRPVIDFYSDGHRITALVWEDRVLTTNLFLRSPVRFHPQAAVDIPSHLDLRQGLPSHVKMTLDDDIGMASTIQLFRLFGHQRLIIGFYRMESHVGPDGRTVQVYCFYKVFELILSPVTLQAMFGDVPFEDIERIHNIARAYKPHPATFKETKARFHALTAEIRPLMGIARSTIKMTVGAKPQSRLQSYLSLNRLIEQLRTEGPYRGRVEQPNVVEHTTEFYGLPLPWRTTGKQRIFRQPPDPDRQKPESKRKASKGPTIPVDPLARFITKPKGSVEKPIHGGSIVISRYEGENDKRTIQAVSDDADVCRRVSRACQSAGGVAIYATRSWLLDYEPARRVVDDLTRGVPHPLPPTPAISIMRPYGDTGRLMEFDTPNGAARAHQMPDGNWVLMHQNKPLVQARITEACRHHGVGWLNRGRNWIIDGADPDLIERVAVAIRDYK